MYRRLLPLLLIGLPTTSMADHLAGGFGGLLSAAPFWTESANTLKKGKIFVGVRSEYQKLKPYSDDDLVQLRTVDALQNPDLYHHHGDHEGGEVDNAHARQADLHSVNYLLGGSFRLAYGVTDALTVGLRLPIIQRGGIREVDAGAFEEDGAFSATQIYNHGNSNGIGDMSFWGQYSLFDDKKHTAALILGFKAPTGATNNTGFKTQYNYITKDHTDPATPVDDGEGRLETHLQPGSGSWDGMFGFAYGYDFTLVQLNSSVMYTLVTTGSQGTNLGDSFNYNLAASVPVKQFTPCTDCSWNFVIEANGQWNEKERRPGNVYIGNSGGHVLYISPGIRFIAADSWNAGVSAGFPIVNNLNGNQSEPDYRIMGTLNFSI